MKNTQALLRVCALGAGLSISLPGAAAGSAAPTLQASIDRAWADLGQAGGAKAEVLRGFRASSVQESGLNPSAAQAAGLACADLFADRDEPRSAFLSCLGQVGRGAFTEALYARLFEMHIARGDHEPSLEERKSLSLLAYVEDLTRGLENERSGGGFWFVRGHDQLPGAFAKGHGYLDFPLEDGDVILGLGNTSLSSTIAATTNPRSRYSHAFIVRKRGELTTVEALVETGVREFPAEHWIKDNYQVLTVLRWKDAATRPTIAAAASDAAASYAARETPYDFQIDLNDDSKMFCTEVVARSYSQASGLEIERILPDLSSVRSEGAYGYVSQIGVRNRRVIAAGDLLNSPYFEVVAEWRRADGLDRAWKLWSFGDLFFERLERGYQVHPDPTLVAAPSGAWLLQLFPSLFTNRARILPEGISPWALSMMGTLELHIFRPSLHYFEDRVQKGRSFTQMDLAELRGSVDYAFDNHGLIPALLRK